MARKKFSFLSEKDKRALRTKEGKQITGIFLFIICCTATLAILINPTPGVDYTLLILILLGLAVAGFLLFLSTLAVFKGWIGEKRVASKLKYLAKKYNGYLINDVNIPEEETGRTSQIDHILFTRYGIYVVETKNYSGYIYGNDSQSEWTQVLNYGRTKNKLYNPVKQNAVHCYRLYDIIGNDKIQFFSVVVFVKANGGEIQSNHVVRLNKIKNLISKDSSPIFDEQDIRNAYEAVNYYKENKVISKKEHVQSIKENKAKIKNGICPRCGGQLVLRTSKNGKQFYGCSNYPKCTFSKNI